jgi:hypothetical protein
MAVEDIQFLFGGDVLEDDKKVGDYKIQEEYVLHLLLETKGEKSKSRKLVAIMEAKII